MKFMIPRLELFKRDSDTIVDWRWHKENDNIDVLAIDCFACKILSKKFSEFILNP